MIGTDDGFWFSFKELPGRVTYTFHHYEKEVESGEVSHIEEMLDRFDALVAHQRSSKSLTPGRKITIASYIGSVYKGSV